MSRTTGPPDGGSRQQKAAALRADMEAQAQQAAPPAAEPVDEQSEEKPEPGPVGQGDYVVKEGDCISSVAKDTGHFWETIWNDPGNADLNEIRRDPNVLLPGDRVTIPDLRPKQEPGNTEMRHRFVRKGEPAKLRLRILEDDEPRANEAYTIEIDGQVYTGTTDVEGALQCPITGNARHARLTIGTDEEVIELALGTMCPIETVAGVQARLNNLAFDCGAVDGVCGPRTETALRGFQVFWNLPLTGEPDAATRTRLQETHGS